MFGAVVCAQLYPGGAPSGAPGQLSQGPPPGISGSTLSTPVAGQTRLK